MSDFDGIRLCEKCGEYTTGRLCVSCAHQEMIDNDDLAGYYPDDSFHTDNDHSNYVPYDDDDHDDDYDRYEDYVMETGNDPYNLFGDDTRQLPLLRLKWRVVAFLKATKHILKMVISAKYRASMDEIPF